MPLPKPKKNENYDKFIDRCMGDKIMNKEFSDAEQRRAVCEQQWDDKKGNAISFLPQVYGKVWAIEPSAIRGMLATVPEKINASELEAYRQRETTRFKDIAGQIHVLPLYGVLTPRASILSFLFGGTPLDYFAAAFDAAIADKSVGAVVIDVDSPGGSVYGIHELTEKIYNARGTKPIIAAISGLGASAAYWVASAADEIIMTPSGEVGSIGIVAIHEDISAQEEKEGIKYTMITAGRYKSEGNPHEPLTGEGREAMQDRVDEYYEMMITNIARNRNVSAVKVKTGFGEGRLCGAPEAKERKMIDKIGAMERVIARLHPESRKKSAQMQRRIADIKAQV